MLGIDESSRWLPIGTVVISRNWGEDAMIDNAVLSEPGRIR